MFTYEKPKELLPLACWVFEGDTGQVMCLDCTCDDCHGCPACWRRVDGQTQYYRTPIHGYHEA